jgi:hypothetical protein
MISSKNGHRLGFALNTLEHIMYNDQDEPLPTSQYLQWDEFDELLLVHSPVELWLAGSRCLLVIYATKKHSLGNVEDLAKRAYAWFKDSFIAIVKASSSVYRNSNEEINLIESLPFNAYRCGGCSVRFSFLHIVFLHSFERCGTTRKQSMYSSTDVRNDLTLLGSLLGQYFRSPDIYDLPETDALNRRSLRICHTSLELLLFVCT